LERGFRAQRPELTKALATAQLKRLLLLQATQREAKTRMAIPPNVQCSRVVICGALLLAYLSAGAAESNPRVMVNERHKALLQNHCIKCHNAQRAKGKIRLDNLPFIIANRESADRWQKVLNALNSGAMPPEEEKPPDSKAKADFLEDLAHVMVSARRNLTDQSGVITMRRLNRREYRNTLRELLGVEIDVNELPADTGTGGFDTAGVNLFISSDQIEQYLALGREALDEAFDRQAQAGAIKKQRFEAEEVVERVRSNLEKRMETYRQYMLWTKAVEQAVDRPENRAIAADIRAKLKGQAPSSFYHSWKKLKGAPSPQGYGFADAELATIEGLGGWNMLPYQAYFLVQPELKTGAFLTIRDNGVNPIHTFSIGGDWPSGDYIVRIRIAATKHATPGRRFVEFGVQATHLSTHEVLGTMNAPQVIEVPFILTKNRGGSFFIREKGTFDSNEQGHRVFAEGEKRNGIGPEFALWVDWTEVEHVRIPEGQMPAGLRALGIPFDDHAPEISRNELRGALERFATEACRGQVQSPMFYDRLLAIYDQRRKANALQSVAIKDALAVVLASPHFIYLAEQSLDQESRRLSSLELATRLSYFLWGAPPDPILRDLAFSGELSNPDVLARQADRLIDDARSVGFIKPFVHQWLGMDRLDFFRFNNEHYPAFDESTKMAARNEVYETVAYLLHQNASVCSLLKSDFVVINGLLAHYYDIEGVHGDEYRKVAVPKGVPRGGLTGTAAILAMGSNGEQTSPVDRGAWVLRKLLDDPPPPAPPNVPQISRLEGKLLTTRERLRAHQEQPQCASCHRKIDPIGLGLENFNAVGQWRTKDSYETAKHETKTWTIDSAAAFHNGPAFRDYFELRDLIATNSEAFARGFSRALLEYALGRARSDRDGPLIRDMLTESRKSNFATRDFIHVLVKSKEFQTK
jgi:hypothetical protein